MEPKTSSFSTLNTIQLSNGETYAYREHPPSSSSEPQKTLLFLHATMCSSQMLNTGGLLDRLVKGFPTYRILAADMRGFGNSSYNKKFEKLDELGEDINLFLEAMKIKSVVLFGACLGGYISTVFAINHPEKVEALILCGAVTIYGAGHMFGAEYPKTIEEVQHLGHYKWNQPLLDGGDRETIKKNLDTFHPKNWIIASHFEDLLTDVMKTRCLLNCLWGEARANLSGKNNGFCDGTGEIAKFTGKTLIIHGELDGAVPIQHARDMQKEIKGSVLAELKGLNHFTWYDDLELTVKTIEEFLK